MSRMYIYQFPFMLLGDFCSHLYTRTCVSPWVSSIAFQPEYRRYARTRWNDYSSRWLLSNGGVSSKWKNPLLSSWWIQKRQSLWTSWGTHAVPHLLYDWIYWETESNPGLPSRHKTQDRAVDVMQQKKLSHFSWLENQTTTSECRFRTWPWLYIHYPPLPAVRTWNVAAIIYSIQGSQRGTFVWVSGTRSVLAFIIFPALSRMMMSSKAN